MYTQELVSFVKKNILVKDVRSLQKSSRVLIEQLINETNFLPHKTPLRERMWYVVNDTNLNPKCKCCDNNVKWYRSVYRTYCSVRCASNDPDVKSKVVNTNILKYGTEYSSQNQEVKNKTKTSNLKVYGTEYPASSDIVRDKIKKTNIKLYGCSSPFSNDKVRQKAQQSIIRNHDGRLHTQQHISYDELCLLDDVEWLVEQHYTKKRSLTEIASQLSISVSSLSKRFKKNNIDIKYYNSSLEEQQIVLFLKSKTTVITNNRSLISPYELDLYLPEYNIAIEYNGIYWHSEGNGRDSQYHLNKTKICNSNNIRLVQIWQPEWVDQQEIVKSRLLNLIGQSESIGARKCSIVKVSSQDKRKFLRDNHIQGDCPSSINLGLQYNDELVAIMTFGKSRFNKKYEYELLRYCNKINTSVTGGASRLFKCFKDQYTPKAVISYSDKRWNTGKLYENLCFESLHSSIPNFFHFHIKKPCLLFSRLQFQKHKLKDKLEFFNSELTAIENMRINGYDRIWDCGNDVFGIEFNGL